MKQEEQNITIAQHCGWTEIHLAASAWGKPPEGFPESLLHWGYINPKLAAIPDYVHDLNAMHEAESWLIKTGPYLWNEYIRKVHYYTNDWLVGEIADIGTAEILMSSVIHAPATIKAKAFLKAIGKWKD